MPGDGVTYSRCRGRDFWEVRTYECGFAVPRVRSLLGDPSDLTPASRGGAPVSEGCIRLASVSSSGSSADFSSSRLSDLGWDDGWTAAFARRDADNLTPARVARVDKGACDVLSADAELRAVYRPGVLHALPCTGDWAAIRRVPGGQPEVAAILPRRTAFIRSGVARGSRDGLSGDSRGQVLAANVDVAFVVEPAYPDTDLARIERLLTLGWESGARPVVLVTKADLLGEDDARRLIADVTAAAPGAGVHAVSAFAGSGLEAVRLGPGQTAVLLGPSGAGKSTLVNALAGAEVMDTQRVRASDGRGRHTTTHRELLVLPAGGLVVDTPGLRRIGLYDTDEGLSRAFADIEELAGGCRFSDCAHDTEPDCAVRAAVDAGKLPGRRLASWRKLRREAEWMASRTDARLRAERTRQWKIIHKEMRRSGRNRP